MKIRLPTFLLKTVSEFARWKPSEHYTEGNMTKSNKHREKHVNPY